MVGGVHFAVALAADRADSQFGTGGSRTLGVGAVFAAGFALAVYIAMGKLYFLPCEVCPFHVLACRCAQSFGGFLSAVQREGNVRRKCFTIKQICIYFCDNRAKCDVFKLRAPCETTRC